jgi:hypothetical protein
MMQGKSEITAQRWLLTTCTDAANSTWASGLKTTNVISASGQLRKTRPVQQRLNN